MTTMTDPVPAWMRDAQEGELRMRLQCNLCGLVEEGRIIIPEPMRDQIAELIRDHPDESLEALRVASNHAAGWQTFRLPDGGSVDVCAECATSSLFMPNVSTDE